MGRAVGDPVPVRVPAARRGLGALLGPDGRRAAADPGARADRDPQVLQRPRVLHAGQPVPARRGARAAPATSSAPASTRSASRRPAAPGARWPSGSSQGEPTTDLRRRRRTPVRAVRTPTNRGCAAGWPRSSACTTPCRGPTASWRPPATSGSRPLHERLAAAGATFGSRRWAGSGRSYFAAAPLDYALGQAALAEHGRRRAASPAATAVAVFDQTSFSQVRRRRAATRSPRCSGSAPPTSTSRSGRRSTRRGSTRAAPTSPTSPSPGSAPTSSCSCQQLRDHRARPGLARRARARGRRRRGPRRHRRRTPCSA